MLSPTLARRLAALFGFTAVALGAFGAHGLRSMLEKNAGVLHWKATAAAGEVGANALQQILLVNEQLATWSTAAHYHLVHAVVLLVLAWRSTVPRAAFLSFVAGILVFSGTLYVLVLTNVKWLGAITPLGGVALLIGWLLLAFRRSE